MDLADEGLFLGVMRRCVVDVVLVRRLVSVGRDAVPDAVVLELTRPDLHDAVDHLALEPVEVFRRVVGRDAGVDAVVPAVDPADQVVSTDHAVGHQRVPVLTAPAEHRMAVVEPHDDEVHAPCVGGDRLAVLEFVPDRHGHVRARLLPCPGHRLPPPTSVFPVHLKRHSSPDRRSSRSLRRAGPWS